MEAATASINAGFVLSGLIIGAVFGFILQRGQFCMNAAFRDTLFMKDFTMFRAYLIALVIMVIGANILEEMGVIVLKRQTLYPLANIMGGVHVRHRDGSGRGMRKRHTLQDRRRPAFCMGCGLRFFYGHRSNSKRYS